MNEALPIIEHLKCKIHTIIYPKLKALLIIFFNLLERFDLPEY
jgi:hypothetical protein